MSREPSLSSNNEVKSEVKSDASPTVLVSVVAIFQPRMKPLPADFEKIQQEIMNEVLSEAKWAPELNGGLGLVKGALENSPFLVLALKEGHITKEQIKAYVEESKGAKVYDLSSMNSSLKEALGAFTGKPYEQAEKLRYLQDSPLARLIYLFSIENDHVMDALRKGFVSADQLIRTCDRAHIGKLFESGSSLGMKMLTECPDFNLETFGKIGFEYLHRINTDNLQEFFTHVDQYTSIDTASIAYFGSNFATEVLGVGSEIVNRCPIL